MYVRRGFLVSKNLDVNLKRAKNNLQVHPQVQKVGQPSNGLHPCQTSAHTVPLLNRAEPEQFGVLQLSSENRSQGMPLAAPTMFKHGSRASFPKAGKHFRKPTILGNPRVVVQWSVMQKQKLVAARITQMYAPMLKEHRWCSPMDLGECVPTDCSRLQS